MLNRNGRQDDPPARVHIFGRAPALPALTSPIALRQPVLALSAGSAHFALVLASGRVMVVGSNKYGQLGLGDRTLKAVSQLRPVESIGQCFRVVCGSQHTLFLDLKGKVFATGNNQQGQLGLGDYRSKWQPVEVQGLTRVTHIFAGGGHSGYLEEGGRFLVAGDNKHGQLCSQVRKLERPTKLAVDQMVS